MPNPSFPHMESITLPQFSAKIQDVVTGVIPTLKYMDSQGVVEEKAGGLQLTEQLDFVANPTFGAIGPNDSVTMTAHLPVTSANYAWKIYAGSLQATLFNLFQNSGSKVKMHDH